MSSTSRAASAVGWAAKRRAEPFSVWAARRNSSTSPSKGPAHLLQQAWTFFQHQAGQFAQGLFLTAHTFQGIRPDQRRVVGCCRRRWLGLEADAQSLRLHEAVLDDEDVDALLGRVSRSHRVCPSSVVRMSWCRRCRAPPRNRGSACRHHHRHRSRSERRDRTLSRRRPAAS